mgnify:CR=1 FL=1
MTAPAIGGQDGPRRFPWATLLVNKDREIARLNAVYERVLSAAGVQILRGRARIVGRNAVEVFLPTQPTARPRRRFRTGPIRRS